MTRHAFLIESSHVPECQDLPGARKDVQNWRNFLKSALGGAWHENEITVLSHPKLIALSSAINLRCQDGEYVFVVFSGHGFEVESLSGSQARICLNAEEMSVPTSMLTPTKFGTAIFDCCRGVEQMSESVATCDSAGGLESLLIANSRSFSVKAASEESSRALFDRSLAYKSYDDPVIMCSCSKGESAGENANAGGYYSTLLMRAARIWGSKVAEDRNGLLYTTRAAHDDACRMMQILNPQQHPEYRPRGQEYPFAIHA